MDVRSGIRPSVRAGPRNTIPQSLPTTQTMSAAVRSAMARQQLVDRRLWTDQQGSDFSKQILAEPALLAMTQRWSAAYAAMVAALGRYDAAAKRRDAAGQCTAAGETLDRLQQASDAAQSQWAYLNQRYDAAAKRLGLTTD